MMTLKIEDMKRLAEFRKGRFISKKYIRSDIKHEWECENGHVWQARPNNILRGRWCPYCAGVVKLTIEYMHNLAENKNGKFLSIEYAGSGEKHTWQCHKGHTWEARAVDIQRGGWCRKCFYEKRKNLKK